MSLSTTISQAGIGNIKTVLGILKGASLGLNSIHLAAIGGNIAQESGGMPYTYNNYACAGICQWGGARPYNCGIPSAGSPYSGAASTIAGRAHINAIIASTLQQQAGFIVRELRMGSFGNFSLSQFLSINNYSSAVLYWMLRYEVASVNNNSSKTNELFMARSVMGRKYFSNDITSSDYYSYNDSDSLNKYKIHKDTPPVIIPDETWKKLNATGDFSDSDLDFDTITADSYDDFIRQESSSFYGKNSTSEKTDSATVSIFSNTTSSKNTSNIKIKADSTKGKITTEKIMANRERSVISNEMKPTIRKEEASTLSGATDLAATTENNNMVIPDGNSEISNSGSVEEALDFDTVENPLD